MTTAPKIRRIRYSGLKMYPEQQAAINCSARISLIEALPKCGKTIGVLDWIIRQALQGKAGWEYWWAAPVNTQAAIAYRRLQRMLRPRTGFSINRTERRITLHPMESIIAFKSGDHPDSLYGEDVHGLVVDEGSRFKADAWYALQSTLVHTRGPMRIIGNVHGRKNWFYGLCRQAEQSQDPELHFARITADDAVRAGVLDPAELESAKKRYPLELFRELYYGEAAEDEGNPFGAAAIRDCTDGTKAEAWLDYQEEGWQEAVVAWGVDLAESGDFTVIIGLDVHGRVVHLGRWHNPWPITKQLLMELITDAPCLVDCTAVGKPLVEELTALKANVQGFLFTSPSKQDIMGRLSARISARQLSYPPGVIPSELNSFEYIYHEGGRVEYRAMEGAHDDTVCALALAVKAGETGAQGWLEHAETGRQDRERAEQERRAKPIFGGTRGKAPTVCPKCGKSLIHITDRTWQCKQCGTGGDLE